MRNYEADRRVLNMAEKSSALFAVGDEVQIRAGASAWMKTHGYWIHDWPESIDGMVGTIMHDYTRYAGDDCHYEVALEGVSGCGVHPQWLAANTGLSGGTPSAEADPSDVEGRRANAPAEGPREERP